MANDDMQRFLEELRARLSIADVVGARVKLTKKGREHQGLCPFHNEKTPSFTVNEAKGFYHCFGCGAHGDIVRFEMDAGGLPFMDAVQKLAHQAGLQVPQFTKQSKEEAESRKSFYEIMEQACAFFERELRMPSGATGLAYFKEKRGLSEETIKKFRLGFAPNNNGLMATLKAQNIDEKDLNTLGLMSIPEDKNRRPHDFFRNRVMIPITDKQGKIIAFGGRVMEKIEPKYLNSPETPIFNKRRNLYNLSQARESAYKEKKLIICEGYMDVIALDSHGFPYAVAPLGTALTPEQITEAWKVCPEPILCLDGDAPGTKAAMRAVDTVLPLLKAGFSLKFMFLPDNQDPDEYLQTKGRGNFAALMEKTSPLIDILWRKYTENEEADTPERKALIEKTLLGEVAKITDPTVRSYYAREIRNRIYKAYQQTAYHSPYTPQYDQPHHPEYPTVTHHPKLVSESQTNPPHPSLRGAWRQPHNAVAIQRTERASAAYPSSRRPYEQRQVLNHTFNSAPEALRRAAENDNDKPVRFILAALLIYPELIEDYEEALIGAGIKNPKLAHLLTVMSEISQETETTLNSDKILEIIKNKHPEIKLNELWELNMFKQEKPFINNLKKEIDKKLSEIRLKNLDNEIKEATDELKRNFSEETYTRLQALKEERTSLLATAEHNG